MRNMMKLIGKVMMPVVAVFVIGACIGLVVQLFHMAARSPWYHADFQPQNHGAQVITTVNLDGWSQDLANRLNHAGTYQEQIAILANSTCATGMALTAEDPNVRNAATLEQIDLPDFVRQAELQRPHEPVASDYQTATKVLCGMTPEVPYGD